MTDDEIRNKLLNIGYQAHQFSSDVNLRAWAAEEGIPEHDAWNIFDILCESNLMQYFAAGSVELSADGVLFVEDNGLATAEQTKQNRQVRFLILDALAKTREKSGVRASLCFTELFEQTGTEECEFRRNNRVLTDLGLIEWPAMQSVAITSAGMEQVVIQRSQLQHLQQYRSFQERSDLTPQARGHELERLLHDILVEQQWSVEANVRAPGEEHDLILHRQLEYYLLECKWVKEPTQPYRLSILRDRVTARMGMRGLFVSMSGYTEEAIKDTIDRLEQAMILLFGKEDVEAVVSHRETFADLLQAKFHAAMTKRAMLIDGGIQTR